MKPRHQNRIGPNSWLRVSFDAILLFGWRWIIETSGHVDFMLCDELSYNQRRLTHKPAPTLSEPRSGGGKDIDRTPCRAACVS